MAIAQPKDILLEQFGQLCYQFLDASVEVWPTCPILSGYKVTFDDANKSSESAKAFVVYLHGLFLSNFKNHLGKLIAKDMSILDDNIPVLLTINAKSKLLAADSSVRDTCLEYAKQIAQSASINDVYSKCPSRMMDQVAGFANVFIEDVKNGKMNISELNPIEISKKVMEMVNPQDIEEFGKQLSQEGGLDGVMNMMQSMLGSAGGGDASAFGGVDSGMLQGILSTVANGMGGSGAGSAAGAGGVDIASIMKMFGGKPPF